MNFKTKQFVEVNRRSSHWNILFKIGVPKQQAKSSNNTCGEITFLEIWKPGNMQLYYQQALS